MGAKRIPTDLQQWIEARKRHRLSHAVVQMARELGLNPAKLGKIDNHKQEPWKAPLPEFIGNLYEKRFGRRTPDPVLTMEQIADRKAQKKAERREEKAAARASFTPEDTGGGNGQRGALGGGRGNAMDRLENRARIREIVQADSELSDSVADEIAFHLTDWLDDLSELYAFMQDPKRVGNEEARKILMGFVIHVPNHLAAASKLWLDIPVTDVFGVGALNESEQ